MKWQVLHSSPITSHKSLIIALLKNRGLKTKKEIADFLDPKFPEPIKIPKKILTRLKIAKKNKEKIIVFGDYDCDGVCATAILWETLYKLGLDAMPYIPDRFTEGYGFKTTSLEKLKNSKTPMPNLIITVDNGIVAYDAVKEAKKKRIDVIVVDHHTIGDKKLATPYILHSTAVCGSALAWFLSKELGVKNGLDLVAIGTIADQMPLLGINRSLVKYGLEELQKTKRVGLKSLIRSAGLNDIGVYEVGYILAPRINAMGRLSSALDSLRILCTRDFKKANDLAKILGETNLERQKIVDDVLSQVLKQVRGDTKIIVIDGDYHEGVIGLASGKITEKFYKPSIVFSKGSKVSKASARSIYGFNIIEAIKETGLIIEGGGHPMAAGFLIETSKISEFRIKINELSKVKLTDEILEKKLKIDLRINFDNITDDLVKEIEKFDPVGVGNAQPTFMSSKVLIKELKPVGADGKHLKLKLSQNNKVFDAIWFGFSSAYTLIPSALCDIAYTIEQNTWNNKTSIQLKIRDIKEQMDQ